MKNPVSNFCKFVTSALLFVAFTQPVFSQAIPVTIQQDADDNWTLFRNNEPYYVKGVGGSVELDKAVSIGGR